MDIKKNIEKRKGVEGVMKTHPYAAAWHNGNNHAMRKNHERKS